MFSMHPRTRLIAVSGRATQNGFLPASVSIGFCRPFITKVVSDIGYALLADDWQDNFYCKGGAPLPAMHGIAPASHPRIKGQGPIVVHAPVHLITEYPVWVAGAY